MKRINILDPQTARLIAAGEITENPASVVKELLENSVDAGADRITLEIKNGGVKMIKVSDNGHGIYRDDVEDAFKRHATSKIKSKEEIEKICSLGFRGEALASIAAVSRTLVITRSDGEIIGTKLKIEGGQSGNISDAGRFVGTDIYVRDLFYNTPARMKFLKKDVVEGNKVASIVDKIALSHPEISFKFIRDGKPCLFSPGDSKVSSAIYSVYGKEFLDGTMKIDYKIGNLEVSGYVSKPEKCRPSKSMQIFFINGRLIKSKLISTALEEAFKNSIMVGRSPYCVIYLKIPFELVDVNVHPAKTEVRFSNEKEVSELIYYAVKNALMNENRESLKNHINSSSAEVGEGSKAMTLRDSGADFTFSDVQNMGKLPFEKNKGFLVKPSFKKASNSFEKKPVLMMNKSLRENFKVVGEVFGCYLVMECRNTLILVDKHAAHERIIFEKIRSKSGQYSSQVLLNPVKVTLEKEEYSAIAENLDLLSKSGYEIEDLGSGTIAVRSAPMYENFDDLPNSIIEIANAILDNKKSTQTKKLDWIYHNIACRSAIKAGGKTSLEELVQLVKDIMDNPELRHCPHGRPIYIEIDKNFIEKRFGRI